MIKSLIIIKPGFSNLTDSILSRFSELGYEIVDRKRIILTQAQCDVIWSDLKEVCERNMYPLIHVGGAEYYRAYSEYITSGEVECIIIQGPIDNYDIIRITKENIRKQYQVEGFRDILHTSDSNEDAEAEINCIF